jgi:hypothetical protein
MKTIVAGSRGIMNYDAFLYAIKDIPWKITGVIGGECPNSPDMLGKRYAEENDIPYFPFPADWDNTDHPEALIRRNKYGKLYNARAGNIRNKQMIVEGKAQALIVLWDGASSGTKNMIDLGKRHNLKKIYILRV